MLESQSLLRLKQLYSKELCGVQAIEKEQAVDSAPASLCKEDSSPQESMRVKFEAAVRRAQDDICKAVSELDGKQFHEDSWIRPGGGGGVSRVLQVPVFMYCPQCSISDLAALQHAYPDLFVRNTYNGAHRAAPTATMRSTTNL